MLPPDSEARLTTRSVRVHTSYSGLGFLPGPTLPRSAPEYGHAGRVDRHLAFVSLPAHGHVTPTLPVVAELARRGWRISYATVEQFGPEVEKAGATLVRTATPAPAAPPPTVTGPAALASFLQRIVTD